MTRTVAVNQIQNLDTLWYRDMSYGQFAGWRATAIGWFAIAPPPMDAGPSCVNVFRANIQASGNQAAQRAGYNPNNYNVVMYYFSNVGLCGWAGWTIGYNAVWINGYMATWTTAHELGHTLGLGHGHSESCVDANGNPTSLSNSCTYAEYGDWYDVMGCCNPGSFTSIQKYSLGWLGGSRLADVPLGGGMYTLQPLESSGAALHALRLVDGAHVIWLEYRQPILEDSFLSASSTSGILFHEQLADGWGPYGSNLLDMTPGSTGGFGDAPLPIGQRWRDTSGNFVVTVNWANANGAQVTIVSPGFVPHVVGLRKSTAEQLLIAAGLSPYVISSLDQNCSKIPGTVVAQSPGGGSSAPGGSEVKIWIDVWPRVCP